MRSYTVCNSRLLFIKLHLLLSSCTLDERPDVEDEDALAEDEVEGAGDIPATSGSRGAAFGGGNELFHSQFYLHTVQQKFNQIVLLKVTDLERFLLSSASNPLTDISIILLPSGTNAFYWPYMHFYHSV